MRPFPFRLLVLFPVLLALLSACGSDTLRLRVDVDWDAALRLPPDVELVVRLEDAAGDGAPLAEQRIQLGDRRPPLRVDFEVPAVTQPHELQVFARADSADRMWLISGEAAVLQRGSGRARVRLQLEAL